MTDLLGEDQSRIETAVGCAFPGCVVLREAAPPPGAERGPDTPSNLVRPLCDVTEVYDEPKIKELRWRARTMMELARGDKTDDERPGQPSLSDFP